MLSKKEMDKWMGPSPDISLETGTKALKAIRTLIKAVRKRNRLAKIGRIVEDHIPGVPITNECTEGDCLIEVLLMGMTELIHYYQDEPTAKVPRFVRHYLGNDWRRALGRTNAKRRNKR